MQRRNIAKVEFLFKHSNQRNIRIYAVGLIEINENNCGMIKIIKKFYEVHLLKRIRKHCVQCSILVRLA